jgi:hypothetical protein
MGLNSEASSRALVIAFRGSMCTENWGVNAMAQMTEFPKSWSGSKVHSGNYHAWSTHLKPRVLQELHGLRSSGGFNRVIFTGHSLGGAIATLAAVDFKEDAVNWGFDFLASCSDGVSVVTFGQPHSGNAAFKRGYLGSKIAHRRFVNFTDPVPIVLAAANTATKAVSVEVDKYDHVSDAICLAGGVAGKVAEAGEQMYDVIKEFKEHGLTTKALGGALASHRHSLGTYNEAIENRGRSTAGLLAEKGIGMATTTASTALREKTLGVNVGSSTAPSAASALETVGGALPMMNAGLGVANLALGAHNAYHLRQMHWEVQEVSIKIDSMREEMETGFASTNENINSLAEFIEGGVDAIQQVLELQSFQLDSLVDGQVRTHEMLHALARRIEDVKQEITSQFTEHEMYIHWNRLKEFETALLLRLQECSVQLPVPSPHALQDMKGAASKLMDQVVHQLTNNKHLGVRGDPKRVHLIAYFVFAARAMEDSLVQAVSPPRSPVIAHPSSPVHNELTRALHYICNEVYGLCEACNFNLFILATDHRPYLQQYLELALGIKEGLALDKCDWLDSDSDAIQHRGEGGKEEGGQVEMVDGADNSNWCVEARRALELEQKFERVCKRYEAPGALRLEQDRVRSVFLAVFAFGDDALNNGLSTGLTDLHTTHSYTLAETARPRIHFEIYSEFVALFGQASEEKWKSLTISQQDQDQGGAAPFSAVVNYYTQASELDFIINFLSRYPHAIRKAGNDEIGTVVQAVLVKENAEGVGGALLQRLMQTDPRVMRVVNTILTTNPNHGRLQEVLRLQETAPQIAVEITKKQLADFLLEVGAITHEDHAGMTRQDHAGTGTATISTGGVVLSDWKGDYCELSDQLFKKYGQRPKMTTTEIVRGNPIPDTAQVLNKPEFPQLIQLLKAGEIRGSQATNPRFASNLVLETKDILCRHSFSDTDLKEKAVVVLLGQTGSGKSTTGNWLGGQTYTVKTATNKQGEKYLKLELNADKSIFETSGSTTVRSFGSFVQYTDLCVCVCVCVCVQVSKTFLPGMYRLPPSEKHRDAIVIDFPGFVDSLGAEVCLGLDLALRELVNRCIKLGSSVHVLSLVSLEAFAANRDSLIGPQLSKIRRHFPTKGSLITAVEEADVTNCCR